MQIELCLETVTPLFLGGAEQQAELRPASVRGALRYWLRAGLGGVLGDNQVSEIARLERKIFGSTDAGSPIVVRLFPQDSVASAMSQLLPHRDQGDAKAWPVGKKVKLILALAPHGKLQPQSDVLLENATRAALLWLNLGGLGRRSRRGAGGFKITSMTHDGAFSQSLLDCFTALKTTPANALALASQIKNLTQNSLDSFNEFAALDQSPSLKSNVRHPILRDETRIVVWTPGEANLNNSLSALSVLMKKMSKTKEDLGGKFDKAFGSVNPRFASPLHVSVHQLSNRLAFVMTYLGSETWQEGQQQHREVKEFFDNLGDTTEAFGGSNE
jgi:CRISPR-associated protein Cmr1